MNDSAYTLIRKRNVIPSSNKPITVLRVKVIRVSCSNIEIREIVEPVMRIASTMLLTPLASELPELDSIVDILAPAKVILARVMTHATQETFLPEEISCITATVCAHSGQCRVMLHHMRVNTDRVAQPYTVSFMPASELDMFHAYMVRHKSIHPEKLKIIFEKL